MDDLTLMSIACDVLRQIKFDVVISGIANGIANEVLGLLWTQFSVILLVQNRKGSIHMKHVPPKGFVHLGLYT